MNNGWILVVMKIIQKQEKKINNIVDYCVIGSGNIALRHYQNVRNLDKKSKMIMCKRSKTEINKDAIKNNIQMTGYINNIYPRTSKSLAIICSPAVSHVKDAILLAKKGFHIFLEKPLSHNMNNIKKLIRIMHNNNTVNLVGYNMRFTDRFKSLKNILKSKNYNDIKKINVYAYTDFRKWRKNKNYKDTVTFKKNLGGGVINELSHEIDYIVFLFNKPNSVYVESYKDNLINADIESNITATFEYKEYCFNIVFKLNMLSRKNKRSFDIIMNDSNIQVDHIANSLKIDEQEIFFKDHIDDSYVREIKNIKQSISKGLPTKLSAEECCSTQQVLDAMHKSLKNNKKVNIRI